MKYAECRPEKESNINYIECLNRPFFLLDEDLNILKTNDRSVSFYGYSRDELLQMNFKDIYVHESPFFLEQQLEEAENLDEVVFKGKHRRKDGKEVAVENRLSIVQCEGRNYYRLIIYKETKGIKIGNYNDFVQHLLRLFTEKQSQKEYLDAALELIYNYNECSCVGIRTIDDEGNISFKSFIGYGEDFFNQENQLSVKHDNCLCIRVINRKHEPADIGVMTGGGAIICNNISEFVNGLPHEPELTHEIVYRSCELKIVLQKKSYAVFEVIFAPRLELSSPVWGTNQELSSEKRQTVSVTLHNELLKGF